MKSTTKRPFADPEKAARKLLELANEFEPIEDGRTYIEKINGPKRELWSCSASGGTAAGHTSDTRPTVIWPVSLH
jgi:hypothetical protein